MRPDSQAREIYVAAGLEGEVSFEAFESAYAGYNSTVGRRRNVLTIIDFTKPSTEQRLWVIDIAGRRVLFHTLVAHGQGSGENYATRFSNRSGSHQSSLGLYLTGATYNGGNGYSMTLDGLEPGVNDNARARSVVVHGAAYVSPSVIASTGRLGRSWGCPALPLDQTRPVIDAIKDGSVLYIHGHNEVGV
ncbi:MAG: murein L,D-transpeptidase catalytic domain family protein [Alistipes sp.]|nr:murein L,D-transpeptidase catalytic domain family protein [Alistipes sp.]